MSRRTHPPRAARWLLVAALPVEDRVHVLGDLHEDFGRRVAAVGRHRAGLWYWRQSLAISARFLVEGLGHDERRWGMRQGLEGWRRDLSHAGRGLLKAPGFAAVTIATLALAIGANTAIFSIVETVLLDPLPFEDPDRLVSIRGTAPGTDMAEEFSLGAEFYVQYRENAAALADIGFSWAGQATFRAGDHVERLFFTAASPTLFTTLGVTPVIGRLPTERDEEFGVAVISHRLWTEWFGRDPDVIGRSIEAAGRLTTVIGVLGPDLGSLSPHDIWLNDLATEPIRPGNFGFGIVGRLAPGEDHESLAAELAVLARRLPERFGGSPQYASIIERHRPVVRSLEEQLVGDIEGPLWILFGTVGIVLLVACANVANLLIVRVESRRQELAVRRALGAGRAALVRSRMAEALLLSALGAAGGLLFAWLALPALVGAAPENVPRLHAVRIDIAALAFTGGMAVLAACLAGLMPALRFSDPSLAAGLASGPRAGGRPDRALRDGFVVVQTASALVLLVGSGLLFQSFRALTGVDPGYDTEDIFTFQAAPDEQRHGLADAAALARFHEMFMDRLAVLPGVESVGLISTLPLDQGAGIFEVATETTAGEDVQRHRVHAARIGGEYFRTMGIELLSGRNVQQPDQQPDQEPADVEVVISRRTADLLWPGEDPLGRRIQMVTGGEAYWNRVVGVVEDVFLRDLRQRDPDPMIYLPMVGRVSTPAYVLRTERAGSIAPEVRELVRQVTPEAPVYRIFTMRELAARTMAELSFTMLTLAVAAGLALFLGAVGLFGVLSYVVSRRTREIGIRMALGARAGQVRRMVVWEGTRVALVGVVLGLLAAAALSRVLEGLLFGVEANHAPTFAATAALMLLVATVASYVPARRASAVDPMRSLRAE